MAATYSAADAAEITTHDTNSFTATRALYVGTGGDLVVTMRGGQEITLTNVADGSLLPIQVTQVKTASTASGLVGLW